MPTQIPKRRRAQVNPKRAVLKKNEDRVRMAYPEMLGAPAGVSQDRQQYTEFASGSARGALLVKTQFALAQLQRISTAAQGNALADNSQAFVSAQLNLTDPMGLTGAGTKTGMSFLSPIFDLIGSAFVRYRVRRLVFHYEPQASASTTERLVFAFANDPVHPVIWNSTPPTQAGLLALSDTVSFAPWRAWSLDVSNKMSKEMLYTFSNASTTVGEFTERFSDFGAIACVTSSVSGTNTPCGILYAEAEVELHEFCPISVTRPSSLARLAEKVKCHSEKRPVVKTGPPQIETAGVQSTLRAPNTQTVNCRECSSTCSCGP